ncbi:hypothetical protein ACLI4U_10370 [Natrialbaceae archaeon A-CW2]|nr:hypothetical protein [Natronosalvus amylolyticus]
MNVVTKIVYRIEFLVALGAGVVMQRDVLGDASCRLEFSVTA